MSNYHSNTFEKVLALIAVSAVIGFLTLFIYLNSLGFPATLPK